MNESAESAVQKVMSIFNEFPPADRYLVMDALLSDEEFADLLYLTQNKEDWLRQ